MKNRNSSDIFSLSNYSSSSMAAALKPATPEYSSSTPLVLRPKEIVKRGAQEEIHKLREDVEKKNHNLGEWIVSHGPWLKWETNSCGKSVWELLNAFGLKSVLPQSGRNGYLWGDILSKPPANKYFDAKKVSHPDKAPPGSIIVFDKNSILWSDARKQYGHVEIKGADHHYYTYEKNAFPSASAKAATKDEKTYKELTGFTGTVYVYNGKKPPK